MSAPLNASLDLTRFRAVAAGASIQQAVRESGRRSDPRVPEANAELAEVPEDACALVRRGSR
jgi:hypothetical protein